MKCLAPCCIPKAEKNIKIFSNARNCLEKVDLNGLELLMFALSSHKENVNASNVAYPNYSKYIYQTSLINTESQSLLFSFSAYLTIARVPMLTDRTREDFTKFVLGKPLWQGPSPYIPLTEVGSWLIL